MLFRYVSASPTCLSGRLTSSRIAPRWSHAACQKCTSTTATAATVEDGGDNRLIRRVAAASKEPVRNFDSSGRSSRPTALHSPVEEHALTGVYWNAKELRADSANRIGATIAVPAFISRSFAARDPQDSFEEQDNECLHIGIKDQTTIEPAQDSKTHVPKQGAPNLFLYGYKEWEDLHDRFLEVRRTRPAETSQEFNEHRNLAKHMLGDITQGDLSAVQFNRRWNALNKLQKVQLLPSLLVGSMVESAAHALFLLSSIGAIPYSFRIRMNCLRDISVMYWQELQRSPELKASYETLVEKLRSPESWPENNLPTVLLQNLLLWSRPEQCQRIIEEFSRKYPNAQPLSVVAIIDHYLRIEDREQAFEYFKRLPKEVLYQPDQIVVALRDRLLRMDVIVKGKTGTNFRYLPQILALGVPSDEALHNAVIESAIINEMPDVAWDLYQYLINSKFRANARSYLVLLRDAFRREDLQRMNELMTAIHERDDLIHDQYLMAYSMNIVRNISYYDNRLGPREAQAHIMALYDRAYDRAPLVRLGIEKSSIGRANLTQPSPTLLAFTIWSCILIQRSERVVLRLWEWIKHLIAQGDRQIVEAAKVDVIYNGLMLFFARRSTSLFRALDVMQYMLSSKLCLPDSRSWSILLCAFLRHGQNEQAHRVLVMMQSRGYKVEEITERYSEYLPPNIDLQSIADKVTSHLDERNMPAGVKHLLEKSPSLQAEREARLSTDSGVS